MVKKKAQLSLFSEIVTRLEGRSNSADFQLIDNEYYVAFDSLPDVQQFHSQVNAESSTNAIEQTSNQKFDIDMKSFAEQFLVDSPSSNDEHRSKRKVVETNERNEKRARRHVRDLPQSSNFIYMSDNDHPNIFDTIQTTSLTTSQSKRIAYEDVNSILSTLDTEEKSSSSRNENFQATINLEVAEPSIIVKDEPTQPPTNDIVETKQEPIEFDYVPTRPMGFGTLNFSGPLDNYVQNIHRSISNHTSPPEPTSSRPKRLRKQKKFYIDETESIVKKRKIRKKPPAPTLLSDAEIERQFGERLSPTMKLEVPEENVAASRVIIDIEPVAKTPIERARAQLFSALRRGHGPDEFLLKLRSRENKIIEIQLAIYSTTDWHGQRMKVLSKIEEVSFPALRSLRVNWTKIDIRVDEFDVEICTSTQATIIPPPPPPTTSNNNNSSWFLKVLSESGPLIVHIHDRRHPEQRLKIKCPCPNCSPYDQKFNESSLPIIVNVSPTKTNPFERPTPTILRRTSSNIESRLSSLQTIHTTFFKELIHHYGTNNVSSVTQCVLDLTLIVSVHTSIDYLQNLLELPLEKYREKYQQIIDPLKWTINDQDKFRMTNGLSRVYQPDILTFYQTIRTNGANIRNAQMMRTLINSFSATSFVKPKSVTTLILPKTGRSTDHSQKQQAHFTPVIELKPILSAPRVSEEIAMKQKDTQTSIVNNTPEVSSTANHGARVIRLTMSNSPSSSTIRLISPTSDVNNKGSSVPLVPKQINIIKPLSSSAITANKLTNPVLIINKGQDQSLTK